MADYTKYISIIAAIIGGGFAVYVWKGKRTKDAKDMFGVFIQEQIAVFPQRDIQQFYHRTKPSIKVAVHRLRHFLGDDQRTRLDGLWKEYDEIPNDQLDPKHEGMMGEAARKLYNLAGSEFQSAEEIVRYYLNEFYKFSTYPFARANAGLCLSRFHGLSFRHGSA